MLSRGRWHFTLALSAAGCLSAAATAQFYVPEPTMLPMSSFINNSYLSNSAVIHSNARKTERARLARALPNTIMPKSDPPANALVFTPASAPVMPRKLALSYPASMRATAENVFEKLLSEYPNVERAFGIARNDIGASTALIVTASYGAYRDRDVPHAQFRVIIRQMRAIIAKSPALTKASNTEKQAYYEQTAILGMLLSLTSSAEAKKQNPQAFANAQKAGGTYLRQMLGVDPDRVVIDDNGVRLDG